MKIRAKKRPHLVDILTTFKYDNKYHLLFRWADGGNLADLWDDGINEVMSYKLVLWIAEQCHGLADGLDGIHNAKLSSREVDSTVQLPNEPPSPTTGRSLSLPGMRTDNKDCGRHGDIKPPNILWFKQDANPHGPGTLKISDFGLTSFHTALTTQVSPAEQNGCTWTYAPPEYDLQEDISRPFDIWSLGCVYLEFMTWALRGSKGVVEFREERSTERGSRPKMRLDNFFVLQMVDSGDQRVAVVKDSVLKVSLSIFPRCLFFQPFSKKEKKKKKKASKSANTCSSVDRDTPESPTVQSVHIGISRLHKRQNASSRQDTARQKRLRQEAHGRLLSKMWRG